jgi:NB-ARC domain
MDKRQMALIFDNVDLTTSENLRSMLPRTHPGGAVLFTTRNEDVALNVSTHRNQDPNALDLQPFSESEAVRFLFRVAGLPDEQRTDASREHAGDLANIVGRLPLAIDQAASFMKLGYSVEDLLELHRGDDRLKVSQRTYFFGRAA